MREFEVKFHINNKFTYNSNFIVDNMTLFLGGSVAPQYGSTLTIQFQRPLLRTTIKIKQSQLDMLANQGDESLNTFRDVNYLQMYLKSTTDGPNNSRKYYYFILAKRWRGEETIELDLVMDVLNTFRWGTADIPLRAGKTLIHREHKDRWAKANNIPYRVIDFYSEGLTPILYKRSNAVLSDTLGPWYLIYQSDENTGVQCYVRPKEDVTIRMTNPSGRVVITANWMYNNVPSNKCIILNKWKTADEMPVLSGYQPLPFGSNVITGVTIDGVSKAISVDGQNVGPDFFYDFTYKVLTLQRGTSSRMNYNYITWKIRYELATQTYSVISQTIEESGNCSEVQIYPSANSMDATKSDWDKDYPTQANWSTWEELTINREASITRTLSGINYEDRTNSKLYKIIEIPYSPFNYTYEEGEFSGLPSGWAYDPDNQSIRLTNLNKTFSSTKEFTGISNYFKSILTQTPIQNADYSRNDYNESKLYHSDFYKVKFTYDSFTMYFPLETATYSIVVNQSHNFILNFYPTSTINSKFLFEFPQYVNLLYPTEDYYNVLPVARNNEMPIYNNEYLNYLRTAYHYDLKAKERTITTAKLGLGLGIAGSVVGGALSIASMNPAVAVSGVAGGLTSIVSNIVGTIDTINKAEEDFASKQEQLKAQSFSVSGSDDIDLLRVYTDGDKAWLSIWEVSSRMKQAIADLFYYCGYATNEQKTPNLNTRGWFNYVQCELSLNGLIYNEECTEEYVRKFSEGVTLFHRVTGAVATAVGKHWDFEQVLENWEVIL